MADLNVEEIKVYSKKYDISGVVFRIPGAAHLTFLYEGLERTIGIPQALLNETYENYCEKLIVTYVEELLAERNRHIQLHYWNITSDLCAHGIVSGHPRLSDACDINTTAAQEILLDKENEKLIIQTRNTEYHLLLAYCDFKKQEQNKDVIPEFEWVYENYKDKIEYPKIEDGKVLLVLSNFDEYFFHSLYCRYPGNKEPVEYRGSAHVGMFQDSYLIHAAENKLDLRYFPHFQYVEFYVESTDNMPLFIQNIGDVPLFAKTHVGTMKLKPGERKEVCKNNCTEDTVFLAGGDLYPAGF